MRIALDDDSASRQLVSALQKGGHEVSTPIDLGIGGAARSPSLDASDPGRRDFLLTRNARDFSVLHDLVQASGGSHPGIMLVHSDNDPNARSDSKGHRCSSRQARIFWRAAIGRVTRP